MKDTWNFELSIFPPDFSQTKLGLNFNLTRNFPFFIDKKCSITILKENEGKKVKKMKIICRNFQQNKVAFTHYVYKCNFYTAMHFKTFHSLTVHTKISFSTQCSKHMQKPEWQHNLKVPREPTNRPSLTC